MEYGADVTKASCYHETALHYALYNKMSEDIIHTMLGYGADVNYPNGTGKTPLTCVTDSVSTIDLLLKWGADINTGDKDGWSPLHYASAEGHVTMVHHLLARGADPNVIADCVIAPTTALALAIQSESCTSREVVKYLVQWNSDVNILSYPQIQPDGNPFFMACFYVFDAVMAESLALGGADRTLMKKSLDTPPFRNLQSTMDISDPAPWHRIKDSLKIPLSLKHSSREVIRTQLGRKFIFKDQLPLPSQLITYLSIPELDNLTVNNSNSTICGS